jgi:hypothetical protein
MVVTGLQLVMPPAPDSQVPPTAAIAAAAFLGVRKAGAVGFRTEGGGGGPGQKDRVG